MKTTSCQICGRQLTDDESIARGFGPDCAAKRATFLASAGTSDAELSALEAAGAARWVRNFHTDMRRGRVGAAKCCVEFARRDVAHKEAAALGLKDAAYFEYLNRRAAGETPAALRSEFSQSVPAAKCGAATRRRMRQAAKVLAAQPSQPKCAAVATSAAPAVDCLTAAIQRITLEKAIDAVWNVIPAPIPAPLRTPRIRRAAALAA